MRKLFSAIFLFLFLIPLIAFSQPYTYESSIDPNEFRLDKWTVMEESEVCRGRYCCAVIKNPDINAEVQYVLMCIDLIWAQHGDGLVKYTYYENGKLVIYQITNSSHYKQVPPVDKQEEDAGQARLYI